MKSVLEVIKENYQLLSVSERKIADYVAANPHLVGELNVSGLAKASGVSDATVVRMCKHLGYNGYHQFTINLAQETGRYREERQEHEALLREKDPAAKVFKGYANIMQQLSRVVRTEELIKGAEILRNASFVHLAALGNANTLAHYLHYRIERTGIRSTAENNSEGFMNQIKLAGKTDVLLAISHSGSSKAIVEAARLAKGKGMKVVAITAYQISPLSEISDVVINCGTGTEAGRDYRNLSYIREFAASDALVEFLTYEGPELHDEQIELEELLANTKY